MKKSASTLAIVGIFAAQICFGCSTDKEKTADAKSNLVNAATEYSKVSEKSVADSTKKANNAEYQIFRTEMKTKIKVQEIRIKELKKTLKDNQSEDEKDLNKRIESLEEKNEDLKKRLDNYGKLQGDWQRFKAEYVRDMDQLGQALKTITLPNKH